MSYVLHFWDRPVPLSVEQALATLSRLSRETVEQNPKFIELAQRLTARYPCISTLDDDDEEEGAWTDGPLDGQTHRPVYGIGLQLNMLEEVRPFVIETAARLGLLTFDMQAAEVHLPSGRVLTQGTPGRPGQAELAPQALAEPLSGKEARDILFGVLGPVMRAHGFEAHKHLFTKKTAGSEQMFLFGITDLAPTFRLDVSFSVRPCLPPPYGDLLGEGGYFSLNWTNAAKKAQIPPAPGSHGERLLVALVGRAGLQEWASEFARFLEAAAFPVAHECETASGVAGQVVIPPNEPQLFRPGPMALVVAHATDGTRFEQMAAAWSAFAAQRSWGHVDALISKLRTLSSGA